MRKVASLNILVNILVNIFVTTYHLSTQVNEVRTQTVELDQECWRLRQQISASAHRQQQLQVGGVLFCWFVGFVCRLAVGRYFPWL